MVPEQPAAAAAAALVQAEAAAAAEAVVLLRLLRAGTGTLLWDRRTITRSRTSSPTSSTRWGGGEVLGYFSLPCPM